MPKYSDRTEAPQEAEKKYSIYLEDTEALTTKFGKSLQDILRAIDEAVQERYGQEGGLWTPIVDTLSTVVVIEQGGKFIAVAWHINEQGNVELGDEVIVERTYTPIVEGFDVKGGETVLEEYIEKEAKIFEAGKYPDKDIEVTEEDLDAIIAGFEEVPIKIEHEDSPLKMGMVKKIWRVGKELFAKLLFPKPAFDLLQYSGAKKLSSAVRRDKTGIAEVSIVRNPRVADAAYYSLDEENGEIVGIRYETSLEQLNVETEGKFAEEPTGKANVDEEKGDDIEMSEKNVEEMDVAQALRVLQAFKPSTGEAAAIFEASNAMIQYVGETEAELKATAERALAAMKELQRANTDRLIDIYKRQGKVTPATEKFARAILNAKPLAYSAADEGQMVTFKNDAGDESLVHFAEMFVKFLDANPPVISFQELARQKVAEEASLSVDEMAWLEEKMGLDKETVAKYNS